MNYEIVEAKTAEEAIGKSKHKIGNLVIVKSITASGNGNGTYSVRVNHIYPIPESNWKYPVVPRHAIQMLVYDESEKLILMHRSNNVRSARNVWSIPTGLHDIGESIEQTIKRELIEECRLKVTRYKLISQYENIAGDADAVKQYHWVLSVYAVQVEDVTKMVNVEPEKHDELKFIDLKELLDYNTFLRNYRFHDSFQNHKDKWPHEYARELLALARTTDDPYYA